MKHIFAFESGREVEKYQDIVCRFNERLTEYQRLLEELLLNRLTNLMHVINGMKRGAEFC